MSHRDRHAPPGADAATPRTAGQRLDPPGAAGAAPDPALDPRQRAAVAAALGTPDLCLIQGPPGTGKSRVVAEIALRSARPGRRVLLLAPGPEALDRALEYLADRPEAAAHRCLGHGERLEALAPSAARATAAGRCQAVAERARTDARRRAE